MMRSFSPSIPVVSRAVVAGKVQRRRLSDPSVYLLETGGRLETAVRVPHGPEQRRRGDRSREEFILFYSLQSTVYSLFVTFAV